MVRSTAQSTPHSNRTGAKPRSNADRTVRVRLSEAVKKNLGDVQTLQHFLATAGELDRGERLIVVDQALIMIDQTYVHLPLKRAMHAVEPVQRLRLLQQRLDSYSERAFHNEMISIFVHLRDLHTNYVLPEPFLSRVAFLPFHIEECFVAAEKKDPIAQYIVTEISGALSEPSFAIGVVVTHWNGIPIDRAVEINAEREAGSNFDARHLQGLQSMTNRWMGMSLPPDEELVLVRYLTNAGKGPTKEARFDWQVFMPPPAPGGGGGSIPGADMSAVGDSNRRRIGIDAKAEMQRRVRKLLFAPQAVSAQQKMVDLGARASSTAQTFHTQVMSASLSGAASIARNLGADALANSKIGQGRARQRPKTAPDVDVLTAGAMLEGVDLTVNSIMPDVIKQFGKVTSPKGTFGYIRIVTFAVADVEDFIKEFIRIAMLLPQEGLIIDVRGNGGGTIAAGEGLLQTLTPVTIEPERFHLINTPLILRMCERDADLKEWAESVAQAIETGATFSQGFPLTPPEFCNSIGQIYQGPVILIVDAGCYSTTDMFAAGFQDHKIGPVLGTSGHTGAGGANVWEHKDLEQSLPAKSSPFTAIPEGASFRVAIRRSTRVGSRSGEPLEDLGVVPDLPVYRMTRDDLLNHNVDLIAHACGVLSGLPRQRLVVGCNKLANGSLNVALTTSNITRVDLTLNERPALTVNVKDGTNSFTVVPPTPLAAKTRLACRGFRGEQFVVSNRIQI